METDTQINEVDAKRSEALKASYQGIKENLEQGILPFWIKNGIDHQYGGYLLDFDQDGNPLERLSPDVRVPEDELQLQIFLGKYRQDSMICEVNPKEHYLVTEHGTVYRVPEEFSRYMVQYQEDCLESLYDEYDGEETMTDEETGGMEN